ncbi:MAG: hypothetical protein ACYTEY_02455 [Planctomycetota bacterium]
MRPLPGHGVRGADRLTKNGFVTLRSDGMEKVKGGLTTVEEVFYVTST